MTSSRLSLSSIAVAATALLCAHEASAATLWRGTAVVTNRSTNAACVAEYDIGDSFGVEYRPSFGLPIDEVLVAFGQHGAFILASGPSDTDKSLRTGSVTIQGVAYGIRYAATTPAQTLSISPAAITPSTVTITITGAVRNLGIPNCHVTVRASLLPIASPI